MVGWLQAIVQYEMNFTSMKQIFIRGFSCWALISDFFWEVMITSSVHNWQRWLKEFDTFIRSINFSNSCDCLTQHRKYVQRGFGECPRMLCRGQPVLPVSSILQPLPLPLPLLLFLYTPIHPLWRCRRCHVIELRECFLLLHPDLNIIAAMFDWSQHDTHRSLPNTVFFSKVSNFSSV